jgi:predicted transcriptional regulator
MKRTIWTIGYFPFTIGGRVNAPMTTEIDMIEEKEVGYGVKAFSWKTPKGSIRISESETGAIVGDSFEDVINDIKETTKSIMQKQINDAKELLHSGCSKHMTNEKFFQLYNY